MLGFNTIFGNDERMRVLIFDSRKCFAQYLHAVLTNHESLQCESEIVETNQACQELGHEAAGNVSADVLVFSPEYDCKQSIQQQIAVAKEAITRWCATENLKQCILLSSTAIYHPKHGNPGRITEDRTLAAKKPNAYAEFWREVEEAASSVCEQQGVSLTTLRCAPVLLQSGQDLVNRAFRQRSLMRFFGHDPSIQFLDKEDLAAAIVAALQQNVADTFNVAPRCVVPLRKALRHARIKGLAIPRAIQKVIRTLLSGTGWGTIDEADFFRYSYTVSSEKIAKQLGFTPKVSSLQAVSNYAQRPARSDPEFDELGWDPQYLAWHGRWLFRFLTRCYWRINVEGAEHFPAQGPVVMVGIHRGFMPFDGVMLIHIGTRDTGRTPRILTHPSLLKFPVLAEFLNKIGAIVASGDNADFVLANDGVLGVFPEGIRGAFRLYRNAYNLDDFGRSDYAKLALSHRAPIVPAVYLGPAETFPIFGRFDWKWWKKLTEWPFFPITTWPWIPFPLPTKWRLRILPALDFDESKTADELHEQVRLLIEQHVDDMRSERKSIFF